MTNNKRFFRTLGKLAFILTAAIAASLLTCEGKLPEHYCGDGQPPYDPLIQFCFEGMTKSLCGGYGGAKYAPPGEECVENTVVKACGNGVFVALGDPCAGFDLTISIFPADRGAIRVNGAPSPAGVTNFGAGTLVTVVADDIEPTDGAQRYRFSGWTGTSNSTDRSITLTMDGDKSLTAVFNPVSEAGATTQILAVSASPKEGGTVAVFAGDTELTGETTTHNHGTPVTVHARPATGYTFTGWAGASESKATPITITMDDSRTLVATFEAVTHTLTVSAMPQAGGTVLVNSAPPTSATTHGHGTAVNVLARPSEGYVFTGWSGASASTDPDITVIMNSDQTLTANFQQMQTYSLTVNASPQAGGTVEPDFQPNIAAGTQVIVTAEPYEGYSFKGWTVAGATISSANSMITTVTIENSNATLTAAFAPIQPTATTYTLIVNRVPSNGGTTSPALSQSGIVAESPFNILASATGTHKFVNWTVVSGTANIADPNDPKTMVTLSSDATIAANFQPVYTLTVSRNITSGGTVTPSSNQYGITAVNISATAASGYTFVNWTVTSGTATFADANSAATTVTLGSNATVRANFQRVYTLTVNATPTYGGTVSPTSGPVAAGTAISISATPASGYFFNYWARSDIYASIADATNATTTVTLSGNATVTANFQAVQTYTLTVGRNNTSGGTVTPSSQSGAAGTVISISATANSGYTFVNWTTSGTATITDPSSAATTVTMGASNATVTANFRWYGTWEYTGGSVTIGTQTWMDRNLNHETANSWCYDNSPDNCAKYGRLYTWEAAMTACPIGWKLPTREDWNTLITYAGGWSTAGKALKSTTGWNSYSGITATDAHGFSALPGGSRDYVDGGFNYVGDNGLWWSATESWSGDAYSRGMGYDLGYVYEYDGSRSNGFSVRCVKDY